MINAAIVIREPGRLKPMAWHRVRLPELPRVGDFVTVSLPGDRAPLGMDAVVAAVWWLLDAAGANAAGDEPTAELVEVMVEAEPATGPYSSAAWRREMAAARAQGIEVTAFPLRRSVIGTTASEGGRG